MGMERNFFKMEINMLGNILMELQMDMGNIIGMMEASIKGISSMESDMVMGSGKINKGANNFQGAIEWTKKKDSGFMSGQKNNLIRDNSKMISGKGMVNFINLQIMGIKN